MGLYWSLSKIIDPQHPQILDILPFPSDVDFEALDILLSISDQDS